MFKYIAWCFVTGLLVFGGFVWMADPFYHYHEPWFEMPIVLDNAVYQTAGAAKNLSYDSAIVGTSMTENMHTSWFDEEMGWKTMKLSYSGARSNDLQAIFGQMDQKTGELKNVFMDINDYQLTCESWTSYVERPAYLYDDHIYNDYKYLFNQDTFLLGMERWLDGLTGVSDNIDIAYTWEEPELFGRKMVLNSSRDLKNQLVSEATAGKESQTKQQEGQRAEKQTEQHTENRTGQQAEQKTEQHTDSVVLTEELKARLQVCQDNLDNILPFIQSHPETNFHIMMPPYSMIYWEQKVLQGELENILTIYAYAIDAFLSCDNVSVYYFQFEPEIISDLDNYRDSTHHRPEYNRYIFECVRDNRQLLTKENYKDKLTEMYEYAKNFPYDSLWEDTM